MRLITVENETEREMRFISKCFSTIAFQITKFNSFVKTF